MSTPASTAFETDRLPYLQALSATYPTAHAAISEASGLAAKLDLPMGLVHVISDIHGEDQKLRHVINNASGALRPLIEEVLKDRLSAEERAGFVSLVYYPREALAKLSPQVVESGQRHEWVYRTLSMQCEIIRALRKTYRRDLVDRVTEREYRELFTEMLSGQRPDFPRAMLAHMAKFDRDWGAIRAASALIRALASAELIVAGDLGDRGPRIDRVIDILMEHPGVQLLWGNHDMIWIGAHLGHEPSMLNVMRFSARYRRASQLEEGYGILTTTLEKLVNKVYADDPAEKFQPKGDGFRPAQIVARMQKALAIMQFKAEGKMIERHPEWNLDQRRLLHKIDFAKGTVEIDGKVHPLLDTHLPTIDPRNPYEYSPEERECVDRLTASFVNSHRLRTHMEWITRHGGMWTKRDDVLIFHACVPVEKDGTPRTLRVEGKDLAGRELMDALGSIVRRAVRKRAYGLDADADWLWYLWAGPRSPLFGKDKMATFESHLIADKDAQKEHKDPYFDLMHEAEFIRKVGKLFGCGEDVLIVNGHVPVKIEKGEAPLKRGGNAVTIDGAFSEAYGDRGYTLVLKPDRIDLAEHSKFAGVEKVLTEGHEIVPKVTTIRTYPRPRRVRDTDEGKRLLRMIDDLGSLATAYQEGLVTERV